MRKKALVKFDGKWRRGGSVSGGGVVVVVVGAAAWESGVVIGSSAHRHIGRPPASYSVKGGRAAVPALRSRLTKVRRLFAMRSRLLALTNDVNRKLYARESLNRPIWP